MRRVLALLLVAATLLAVGCSATEKKPADNTPAKKAQVVRINIGTEPKTLDPGVSTGMPEANLQLSLYEGLMRLDKDGRAVPGLAAAMPEVKDNGSTYVFKIRPDAKWSNGEPITADDFVWTWQRNLDPRTASEYAYQLYYIKGGEALNTIALNKLGPDGKEIKGTDGKPVARSAAEIKADVDKALPNLGVKALDKQTLEVKLEAPSPYFLSLTAFHTLYPIYRKSVEANADSWFRDPKTMVTSGPFKMDSWDAKSKIIVSRNPNYWDAKSVKLDKIEYFLIDTESTSTTMYETGDLDIIESGVSVTEMPRLKKERPNELKILPDLGTYFYRFNTTKAPFDKVEVRKALTLAIDRVPIVEQITQGGQIPATAFVPGGIPDVSGDFRANGKDFYKNNDLQTAKDLLAKAGYPDGKGFPKVEILYNTSEAHKKIAEAIQEQWKKNLGIEVTLTNAEWGTYLDRESKLDYQVARAGWIGDYIDPMTFIDMFVTGGGNNETGWSNKQFDALVKQAKSTADQKVRMQAMHDAEKIMMDEMPIMPIYFYTRVRLVSPKVKGWSEPLTSGMNLRDAYVE